MLFDFYDGIIKIENNKTFMRSAVDFCTSSYKLEMYSVSKIVLTCHYSNNFSSSLEQFFLTVSRSEQFWKQDTISTRKKTDEQRIL